VAGGVTTTYTYDREDILREVRAATTRVYVHGLGVDEPLAVDDGGTVSYFHSDALGSIANLTNAAGGVTLARQYDAWGNLLMGGAEPGYAFTGREWDPETGLYSYRNRYYSALQGRFISEDPIGLRGGNNLYAYVEDDPVNATDPYGWQAWTPNIRRPIECELFWGTYARAEGKKHGWPYAHCLASCLIAKFCSQPQSVIAAYWVKEPVDTLMCVVTRNPGYCDSAWQPSDIKDNFTGATCPQQMDCWQACDPLKGQTGDKAPPPGPMGGWGRK
jgi:RHS repeat-associated protein